MSAPISMTLQTDGAASFRKSDMERAGRVGMRLVGKLHHRLFKPKKFAANAQQRYKLRHRGTKYRQAKRIRKMNGEKSRAIGLDRPFIWSGRTRDLAMANSKVKAKAPSATRHYVDVVIKAPQLNRKPWLREEMERINKNEITELQKQGIKRYERELTRRGRKVTRRTK